MVDRKKFQVSSFEFQTTGSFHKDCACEMHSKLRILLAIEFDDELLVHRQLDLIAFWQSCDAPFVIVPINLQPSWRGLMASHIFRVLEHDEFATAFAYGDLVSDIHFKRGNVDLAS